MPKKAFVIWAKQVKLSEFLAKSLGAQLIISYKEKIGPVKIPVVLRYLVQTFDTWIKLFRLKPQVVWVQNPPVVAVLVVWIYCLLTSVKLVIDTHTAGFLDRKWQAFHWLHKFLAKRAVLNTVHNYKNLEILKQWGIENGYVLQFYNPSREEVIRENVVLDEKLQDCVNNFFGTKVFMVNRFANDDAWQEVADTAKLMPGSLFFISGDANKISQTIKNDFPRNVILTGYLAHEQFIKLMDSCDVVLALTKRKDTVLWSIREIMAMEKPFIVSDSEVLRHYFSDVAIFTNHQPQDLKQKIQQALEEKELMKNKIKEFLEKDKIRWEKDIETVTEMIGA